MNWGTAERIFQRKPYLLDPYRCRSMKDAKELLAREGMPSAEQVLTAARLRAGMSMSEWEAYTGMSTKTMERKCKRVTPVRFGGAACLAPQGGSRLGYYYHPRDFHGLHSFWTLVGSQSLQRYR